MEEVRGVGVMCECRRCVWGVGCGVVDHVPRDWGLRNAVVEERGVCVMCDGVPSVCGGCGVRGGGGRAPRLGA